MNELRAVVYQLDEMQRHYSRNLYVLKEVLRPRIHLLAQVYEPWMFTHRTPEDSIRDFHIEFNLNRAGDLTDYEGVVEIKLESDRGTDYDESFECPFKMLFADEAELKALLDERQRAKEAEKAKAEAEKARKQYETEQATLKRLLDKYGLPK